MLAHDTVPQPHRVATVALSSLLAIVTSACNLPFGPDPEPGRDALGTRGAVTAGHPLAAEAGLRE